MRELHLKLRTLSLENTTCPDSERFPFLQEIIKLDKKLHKNWDVYDHYVAGSETATTHDVDTSEDDSSIIIPVEEEASKEATDTATETVETVADAPEAEAKATTKKAKAATKRSTKKASKK
jgi:hypothetical protein